MSVSKTVIRMILRAESSRCHVIDEHHTSKDIPLERVGLSVLKAGAQTIQHLMHSV